jgi:hypothetical protein
MKWWQIKKRDADLERELRSDLELEEESSGKVPFQEKRLATQPARPLAIVVMNSRGVSAKLAS